MTIDPRPQAWYFRIHPTAHRSFEPEEFYDYDGWGIRCRDCGTLDTTPDLQKLAALEGADAHAWKVHGVAQPVRS